VVCYQQNPMTTSENKEEKRTVIASDHHEYGVTAGNSWLQPMGQRPQLSIVIFPELTVTEEEAAEAAAVAQHRLEQRQNQITLGKATMGYTNYTQLVPKSRRRPRWHPNTPDPNAQYSKRQWDGLVRKWRRQLHTFDGR